MEDLVEPGGASRWETEWEWGVERGGGRGDGLAGMGGEMRGYGEMGGDGVWEKVGEGRLGTEPGREGVGVGPREEVSLWLPLSPFPLGCLALGSSVLES